MIKLLVYNFNIVHIAYYKNIHKSHYIRFVPYFKQLQNSVMFCCLIVVRYWLIYLFAVIWVILGDPVAASCLEKKDSLVFMWLHQLAAQRLYLIDRIKPQCSLSACEMVALILRRHIQVQSVQSVQNVITSKNEVFCLLFFWTL